MKIIRYVDPDIRYGILELDGTIRPLVGSPFEKSRTVGKATHRDKVRILAPVVPRNIYGAGLNYVNHAREMNLPLPPVPMLFMKPATAVIGPDDPIVYPLQAQTVHYEAEVAVVIGKGGRHIAEAEAGRHILGLTCGNDVSERVIQAAEMKQGCLVIGKAFDSFNPLGPAIETDLDPGNVEILARLNGIEMQRSNTSDLVYSIRRLVSYLSDAITLQPGDVVMTGTPSGVGPIKPGDIVEIEIPQVGILRNPRDCGVRQVNGEGKLRIGVLGIDHRHIYGMLQGMLDVGCEAVAWWTEGDPIPVAGFQERFPALPRVSDRRAILEDKSIDLVLIAAVPAERAELAIAAMMHGKDVMVDKPGCVSKEQLDALRRAVAKSGRIWSVDFSERFEVPAVTMAAELVAAGAIGRVVQTVGLGPHRHNPHLRPAWFYERAQFGGILCDIGSHQIDQFLFFTGSETAEIVSASSDNFANPAKPDFEDFGEILLRSEKGRGYIRVDWYTPDALPTWGDGRLVLLGTEGTIELRKYVDIGGPAGTDHLLLVNKSKCERIDASRAGTPYFARLAADVRQRTHMAMPQSHAFTVTELALRAQAMADMQRR